MIDFFELLALAWVAKAPTIKEEEAVGLSLTGSAPVEDIQPMVRATARGVAES